MREVLSIIGICLLIWITVRVCKGGGFKDIADELWFGTEQEVEE
tara:strand:+ start:1577 stop:1708 length:132 start_codon:yes stop_codon:yes gene_type:complete